MVRSADRTSLQDLAAHLGVSQMTVRRDLDHLERQGLVRRVRGGVVPLDDPGVPDTGHPTGPGHPTGGSPRGTPTGAPEPWDAVLTRGTSGARPVRRLEQTRHLQAGGSPPQAARSSATGPRAGTAVRSSPWAGPTWPGQRGGHEDRIGAAVASMLSPGTSVLLDAGTTAEAVAQHLAPRAPLTVAVTSLRAGAALTDVAGITLLVLGGRARPDGALVGPLALDALEGLDVDVFVMSAVAAHPVSGWGAASLEEAELKRAVMQRAASTIVAADAGVLGARALARVAPLGAVSALVTDARVDDSAPGAVASEVLTAIVAAGVPVHVV